MTYVPSKATGTLGSGKDSFPAYTMLALTLIGIAVALYVAKGNYSGEPLWCPIIDRCNVVVNSPYSRIFGVPMAYFGFIYYLYMFALAARLAFDPFSNSLRFRAVLYAGVGAGFVAIFYVPSARRYSGGVHLLPHLCRHHVPTSVRSNLARSRHPQIPSGKAKRPGDVECPPVSIATCAAYISWEVDSGTEAAVACAGQRRHTPNFPRERR